MSSPLPVVPAGCIEQDRHGARSANIEVNHGQVKFQTSASKAEFTRPANKASGARRAVKICDVRVVRPLETCVIW